MFFSPSPWWSWLSDGLRSQRSRVQIPALYSYFWNRKQFPITSGQEWWKLMLCTVKWVIKKSPAVESSTWPLHSHNCSKNYNKTKHKINLWFLHILWSGCGLRWLQVISFCEIMYTYQLCIFYKIVKFRKYHKNGICRVQYNFFIMRQ